MKKMVFAVTTDLTYDQRMQRICTSLAQHGYDVLLVGRRRPGSRPLTPQIFRQHRLRVYFTKGKLFYLEYNLRLFWFLLGRTFDVYGAADLDTAVPVFLKAKYTHKPFVYDAHEYFSEVPEVVNRPLVQLFWTWLEQFIMTRTRFAYTVTESLAALFEAKYQVPFAVIRNCALLVPEITDKNKSTEKYLLYQGAVNAGRGLETLLRAMPLLDVKLIICGEGDLLTDLQQLRRELCLTDKVIFRGYILPEELKLITQHAYLGINLLETCGLSYYYSLGNKFFDYLHAGVPQLLVDFPEYRRLNEVYEVGKIVTLTPEAIVAAVTYFLQHPEAYKQLAWNCQQARLQLNWQYEEKKLLAFYHHIWNIPHPPTPAR